MHVLLLLLLEKELLLLVVMVLVIVSAGQMRLLLLLPAVELHLLELLLLGTNADDGGGAPRGLQRGEGPRGVDGGRRGHAVAVRRQRLRLLKRRSLAARGRR